MVRKFQGTITSDKSKPNNQRKRGKRKPNNQRNKKRRPNKPLPPRPDERTKSYRVPAGYGYRTSSSVRTRSAKNNTCLTISGYDLVYRVSPDETLIDGAFVAIPANPAYWTGTRIGQVATAYSQWRPLYLRFDFFPAVGTGTNGVITSGTFWNQTTEDESLTQSLVTSNGGKSHPCYVRQRTVVRLKSNLEKNLFQMDGRLNEDSNPFIFLATTTGVNGIIPGYYMAAYTYELKNPIGDGNEYEVITKTAGDLTQDDIWEATSAVVMSDTNVGIGPGTVLAIELITTVSVKMIQFFLKGSQAGILADTVLKIFRNRNKSRARLDDGTGNFRWQWMSGVEITDDPGYPTYLVIPDGDFGEPPRPAINVNTTQWKHVDAEWQLSNKVGFLLRIDVNRAWAELYWVNQSPETIQPADNYYQLSSMGWNLTDGRAAQVRSIRWTDSTQNRSIYPRIVVDMTQVKPDGNLNYEQHVFEDFDSTLPRVLLAEFPNIILPPITNVPSVERVIGRGPAMGKHVKFARNRVVNYPKIKGVDPVTAKLRRLQTMVEGLTIQNDVTESEDQVDDNVPVNNSSSVELNIANVPMN